VRLYTQFYRSPSELLESDTFGGLPLPHTLSLYRSIVSRVREASRHCDVLLYSVSVIGPSSEPHHFAVDRPPQGEENCALFLLLNNVWEENIFREHDTTYVTSEVFGTQLENMGWRVFKETIHHPQELNRRVSRYPKLLPGYFFPYAKVTVYCDCKLLKMLSVTSAHKLADFLLRDGASFGIVQHPQSDSLAHEIERISNANSKRPLIDSLQSLALQWLRLSESVSPDDQRTAGVEGRLKASRMRGPKNAAIFERVWYDEFSQGSDRDQIAFYAAFSRMEMQRVRRRACHVYDRTGRYESRFLPAFTMNIECSLSSLVLNASSETIRTQEKG